jgi:hypothetical protein
MAIVSIPGAPTLSGLSYSDQFRVCIFGQFDDLGMLTTLFQWLSRAVWADGEGGT